MGLIELLGLAATAMSIGGATVGGLRALLSQQSGPVDRAIRTTATRFEEIPGAEDCLRRWIAASSFETIFQQLQSGERRFSEDDLIGSFIRDGEFHMPTDDESRKLASSVVSAFLGGIVEEFYAGSSGVGALASRMEALHMQGRQDQEASTAWLANRLETTLPGLVAKTISADDASASDAIEDPTHRELSVKIDAARDLINRGLVRTARENIEQLLRTSDISDDLKFRAVANLGACALGEGDKERACELFDDAYLIDPTNVKGITNQAVAASLREEHERARKFARKAMELEPNSGAAAAVLIHTLHALGETEELEEFITKEPWVTEDNQAGLALAQIRVSQSCAMEAISICERLADKDLDDFHTALLLGQTLLNEAQAKFSRSGGSDVESYPMLVRAEAEADRAIRLLKNTQRDSLRADAHALRALVLGALGRTEDAAWEAERALEDAPHHHAAMLCRGLTLLQARKPREAIEAWKNLRADEFPDGFEIFLADAHLGAGESTEARDILRGKLDFEHPGLHLLERVELLARADSHDGLTSDIWRDLEVATAQHPEDSYLLTASAIRSRVRGDDEHAAQLLERALDSVADTDRWTIQLRLAEVHMSAERYSKAAGALAEVVGEVARHPLAERLLVCLVNGGRYREALDWCQQMRGALSDCPKAVIDAEAQLLERAGDLATTRTLREQLCQRSDATARDYFRLALVQFRSGDQDAARLSVRRIDQGTLGDDPQALLKVAQMKMVLGESEYLRDAYVARQLGRQDPDVQLGYFQMHMTCEGEFESPELAAPGCCVLLRNDEGDEWWRILEEGENGSGEHDVPPDDSLAQRLIGRKCGERIVLRDDIEQRSYEVVQVQSKYTRAFQEIMQEFSTRFPDSRKLSRIEYEENDCAPLLELVDERSRSVREIGQEYSKGQSRPFASFCALFGESELAVWRDCTGNGGMPIRFSSGSDDEAADSLQVLQNPDGLVLDIVALLTFHELGVVDELLARFGRIVIPQYVIDSVREEYIAADRDPISGRLGQRGDGRYQFVEISDENRREQREFVHRVLALVDSCEPGTSYRMLEVGELDDIQGMTLAGVGTVLADVNQDDQHLVLVCDDFPLAEFAREMGTAATSSQAVLRELQNADVISSDRYSELIERLASMNYTFLRVSADDIVRRLRANGYQTTDGTRAMLRTLRGPECSDKAAVSVAAATVAEVAQSLSEPNLTLFVALVMSALHAGREFTDIWSPFRVALERNNRLAWVPPIRSTVLSIVDDHVAAQKVQLTFE